MAAPSAPVKKESVDVTVTSAQCDGEKGGVVFSIK
jgi:hypothetical protein